jgi:hypothetical protein
MKFLNPEEPTLERELIYDILPEVPHLAIDYHADMFKQMYDEMVDRTIFMTVKFTAGQLAALRTIACAEAGSNEITKSDAVVAYIATVLSRIAPEPIRQIVNVVDVRFIQCRANHTNGREQSELTSIEAKRAYQESTIHHHTGRSAM